MYRRTGGGAARGGAWSSTTSTLGRWAASARSRIFGCAAELTINAMRGSILGKSRVEAAVQSARRRRAVAQGLDKSDLP